MTFQYTVIILAGGLGTRLQPVVSDVPKPMAPINSRPFMEYLLEYLQFSGCKRVVFSIGFKASILKNHFGQFWGGIEIEYCQEEIPLGTGGAMVKALKQTRDSELFLVLNGDTFFPIAIKNMSDQHKRLGSDMTIALFDNRGADRYSAFDIKNSHELVMSKNSKSSLRSGGVYLLSDRLAASIKAIETVPLSFEEDLTPKLIKKFAVSGYVEDAPFIDIGVPEDYRFAQNYVPDFLTQFKEKNIGV